MNPIANKLFETENLFQTAVAIGYDLDPEELEVRTVVQPLVCDAAFEVVCTVVNSDTVAACIAGRGATFEEAIDSLHSLAQQALAEAKNPERVNPRSARSAPAARPSGHLRLVHSA